MGLVLTLVSLFMAASALHVDEKPNMETIELLEIDTHDDMEPLLEEDEYFDA
jgi:hypothetical protein